MEIFQLQYFSQTFDVFKKTKMGKIFPENYFTYKHFNNTL